MVNKINHYSNNYNFGEKKYEISQIPTQYQIEEIEKKKDKKIKNAIIYTLIGFTIVSSLYNIYNNDNNNNENNTLNSNNYKIKKERIINNNNNNNLKKNKLEQIISK